MQLSKIIFTIIFISTGVFSDCWTPDERHNLFIKKLDGTTTLSFKDGISCKSISNAKVYINNKFISRTKNNGSFSFSSKALKDIYSGNIQIKVEKQGYITFDSEVRVMLESIYKPYFLMSKIIPLNKARFILSWGKKPKDLDLHLKSNNFHISYRNKKNIKNIAKLDRDDTNGYGPETITLDNIKSNKIYKLYVHQYSSKGSINDKTSIQVYQNNKLNKNIILPNTRVKCIQVLIIKNKKIAYKVKAVKESNCK